MTLFNFGWNCKSISIVQNENGEMSYIIYIARSSTSENWTAMMDDPSTICTRSKLSTACNRDRGILVNVSDRMEFIQLSIFPNVLLHMSDVPLKYYGDYSHCLHALKIYRTLMLWIKWIKLGCAPHLNWSKRELHYHFIFNLMRCSRRGIAQFIMSCTRK